jgi:hypothetical protein
VVALTYRSSLMAQNRPQKVGKYERVITSRASSIVIALVVLAMLIILAVLIF